MAPTRLLQSATTLRLLLSVILCACSAGAPGRQADRRGPETFVGRFADLTLDRAGQRVRSRFPDGPNPLPGRLLVKIDPAEVLYRYKLPPTDAIALERIAAASGVTKDLHVTAVEELGSTAAGKRSIRFQMAEDISVDGIRHRLAASGAALRQDLLASASKARQFVVDVPRHPLAALVVRPPTRRYPQLRSTSSLHAIFDRVGVMSIQRVFRSAELRSGAQVKVRPVADLLDDARRAFRIRAGRAPRDARIPDNMENWFLLRLDTTDLVSALDVLRHTSGIQEASYDYAVVTHQADAEPDFSSQWALHGVPQWGISARQAWAVTPAAASAVVAVVDRGIKEDLDEFSGRLWSNPDEIAGNGVDDDNNGYVDDATGITVEGQGSPYPPMLAGPHGVMVAGLIAANSLNGIRMAGVAGGANVRLMNVSLGAASTCAGAAEGVLYAVLEGADVVNMSWGTVPEGLLWQAIQAGVAGGATFVASAGNGNQRVAQNYNLEFAHYPSSWPEVISVGATDGNGHRWVDATDPTLGSNYGVTLDLTAPGKDVLTISFSSPTQTAADSFIGSGTSFSAAIVSGAAALLLANYPTMRSEQVQAWLRQTAVDLVDPENTGATLAGEDFYSGAGLVNVGFALTRGTPDPVVVSLAIERPWYQDVMGVDNAVGATPDLALRVEGPWVGSWRLDIGEGDWPASWTAVPVPAAVAAQPINVGVQTDTSEADVDNGHRYLDTHLLSNRRLYTLRLSARDSSRNAPQYPAPLLGTLLPSLPSATRREITLTVWSGNGTATVDRQRITTDWSNFPAKPGWPVALPPRGIANGYRSLLRGIRAVDLGGGTRRILVQVDGHFVCIRPDGAPVWDQPIDLRIDYGGEDGNAFPAFVVDDVDGDGTKEILVSGLIWDGLVPHVEIRLLRPDGTSYGPGWPLTFPTEADGLYWEAFGKLHVGDVDGDGRKEIIFYEKAHNSILIPPEARGIGKIHVVRLDGTPAPGWPRQFMVPQGRLAVGNLDGDTADEIVLDAGDGFIAFDGNGSVLSGWPAPINRGYQRRFELTQLDAGPELELLYSQIGANSDRYEVGVIEHFGRPKTGFPVLLDSQVSRAPGEWPRANPSSPIFAQAAQVIPGGDPEIVVAYDKVQVLNPNGTIATTFPMIDLGAQSLGLQVLDLDHDGSPPEFVIPVLYWQNDDGYIQPAYEDLVAYRRNGTAVANPSWPVHLQMPFWFNHTAPAAHVADIDGDGRLEVIHARIPMNVDEAWIDAFEIR